MAVVNIKGVIAPNDDQWIYDVLGMDAVSPNKVNTEIKNANGGDLEVLINSPGGEITSASEIYTTLKSYPGNVTVKIIGMAASAASVIAMAGKTVLMSPTAYFMIHNVSGNAHGDYNAMDHMSEVMKTANISISNAYRIKTGMSEDELLSLMDKESYFTPQKALSYGFIDGIMFDNMTEDKKAQAQLNLLKLKQKNI